jgi:hypothetical protein
MINIKAPVELSAGKMIVQHRKNFLLIAEDYYKGEARYCLDLSEVEYADSMGFRLLFDFLSVFTEIIPPKNRRIVEDYNTWLDSKKGLSKGRRDEN